MKENAEISKTTEKIKELGCIFAITPSISNTNLKPPEAIFLKTSSRLNFSSACFHS